MVSHAIVVTKSFAKPRMFSYFGFVGRYAECALVACITYLNNASFLSALHTACIWYKELVCTVFSLQCPKHALVDSVQLTLLHIASVQHSHGCAEHSIICHSGRTTQGVL